MSAPAPSKGLNIGLWIAQVLLFLAFLGAGGMKLFMAAPPPEAGMGLGLIRFIGVSEVLGALGMLVPALTRIAPKLTGVAGFALALVMVLAFGFHMMRGEVAHTPPSVVLFVLAAFVGWGRTFRLPIAPR